MTRIPTVAADVAVRFLVLLVLVMVLPSMAGAQSSEDARPPEPTAAGDQDPDYRLGVGDVLNISVFGEPELSQQSTITESGRITFAFLGEQQASGLTVRDLEGSITEQLRNGYLVNPKVRVTISTYRPFFVNGQVAKPGSYPFQPGMTVRRAITVAGGLTERASERKIRLTPETHAGERKTRNVGMDERVFPGDVITVDESFF